MTDIDYWSNYYKKKFKKEIPSPFAEWTLSNYLKKGTLLELGCGNGRDSMFFAEKGLEVVGFDQCSFVVDELNKMKVENATFICGDFTELTYSDQADYVYSRFTLHSVNAKGASKAMNNAYQILKPGGLFLIEVRGIHDDLYGVGKEVERDAWFTDHYRRFVRFDEIKKELTGLGFELTFSREDHGFAPYGDSDPKIIRIVAKK